MLAHLPLLLLATWFITAVYLCVLIYTLRCYIRTNDQGWLWISLLVSYAILITECIIARYIISYSSKYYLDKKMSHWFKPWWMTIFLSTIAITLALYIMLFIAWLRRSAD